MLKTKRQRDQAACGLIVTVPVVLFLIIFCAVFVRNKDKRNAEMASERASEATAACWASRSSRLAGLPRTQIYMPLVDDADYITILGFGGNNSETTTWGVATRPQWCSTNAAAFDKPYLTYTIGPAMWEVEYSTTSTSTGASYTSTGVYEKTGLCTRPVLPQTIIAMYGGSSRTREQTTLNEMTCTWSVNDNGYKFSRSTWFFGELTQAYFDVTIVGETTGLIRATATDATSSTTSRPETSMVTETRAAQRNSTLSQPGPVTSAPSTTYLTASIVA